MIIFKPEWIVHKSNANEAINFPPSNKLMNSLDENKKNCIFSMDVSPDGTQLATGSSGKKKKDNALSLHKDSQKKN